MTESPSTSEYPRIDAEKPFLGAPDDIYLDDRTPWTTRSTPSGRFWRKYSPLIITHFIYIIFYTTVTLGVVFYALRHLKDGCSNVEAESPSFYSMCSRLRQDVTLY